MLDSRGTESVTGSFGYQSSEYKVVDSTDGYCYALRRVERVRTNNEIVREAVKDDIAQDAAKEAAKKGTAEAAKELGKEAAVQGAETAARGVAAAGTGGLALAVEVGYKILSSVAEELKHQITR